MDSGGTQSAPRPEDRMNPSSTSMITASFPMSCSTTERGVLDFQTAVFPPRGTVAALDRKGTGEDPPQINGATVARFQEAKPKAASRSRLLSIMVRQKAHSSTASRSVNFSPVK